jgi:hypothetical protein
VYVGELDTACLEGEKSFLDSIFFKALVLKGMSRIPGCFERQ